MAGPDVSLILAAWRPDPRWLIQAVESALSERDCELELIVVDDGSPEPVEAMLSEVADPRLRVLRVDHGGAYAARNAGIAASRGRWLRFVDADDLVAPGSTARLLALAVEDPSPTISYGATLFCDERLRPQWTMRSRRQGMVAEACLLGHFTVRMPAMLFPRVVVEQAGDWYTGMRVSGDWDWVLRCLERCPVRGHRRVEYVYRRHAESMTADLEGGEQAAREVVDRFLERHPHKRGTALERRARAMLAARSARVRGTHGQAALAARRATEALRIDPRAVVEEARQLSAAMSSRLVHAARARWGGHSEDLLAGGS